MRRLLLGTVDIGAYEFGLGDYDCDQTVNLTDFANWEACMTDPTLIPNPSPRREALARNHSPSDHPPRY